MTFKRLSISLSFVVFFLYGGLVISLFYFYDGGLFVKTLTSERTLFSIRLSLITATIATLISVGLAIPSAYALSRYTFFGRELVDMILELPMVVSPVALGAMLLIFFNTPYGRLIEERGIGFIFTVNGIMLAQFITTLGIATRLIRAAMDEIPERYEAVARTLGASPVKAFLTVTLPLSKRGIIAATVLAWAKAVGEFGATITVAGSMALKTETIPVAIYMRLASADIEGAVVFIIILISISFSILFLIRFLVKGRAVRRVYG